MKKEYDFSKMKAHKNIYASKEKDVKVMLIAIFIDLYLKGVKKVQKTDKN